jgi:CHAD domain-containing protein
MSAASNKWIPDFGPDTPLDEAAKIVLASRMETLAATLPRVIKHPQEDPEDVHQLRVAARRATAALDEFASCPPEAVLHSLRDRVRLLRRSAGEARDWDVFAARVQSKREQASDSEIAGIDYLLGYAQGLRSAAQQGLEDACDEFGAADLKRLLRQALKSVRSPEAGVESRTALALARTTLGNRIAEFLSASEADTSDYKRLHQVRIQGKRLRYAMELFANCCDSARWQEVYAQLAETQETLGKANDRHVASKKLGALRESLKDTDPTEWGRVKSGILGLLQDQRDDLRRESKRSRNMIERWKEMDPRRLIADLILPTPEP